MILCAVTGKLSGPAWLYSYTRSIAEDTVALAGMAESTSNRSSA